MTKHQQNDRKCKKKLGIYQQKLLPNNPWTHTHHWDQLWSLSGDLKRKSELAPS
jgi:hypothetical protein